VAVPPNSTATVFVPAKDAGAVRESGRPASAAPGVKPAGMVDGRGVFRLESGNYEFESSL
jgi:alpha-L-rhamnosidase